MTKQESISSQLLDLGFQEQDTRSRKYRVFSRPETKNLYIGKAGAIRYGHTISDSMSMTPRIIATLQRKYKRS